MSITSVENYIEKWEKIKASFDERLNPLPALELRKAALHDAGHAVAWYLLDSDGENHRNVAIALAGPLDE